MHAFGMLVILAAIFGISKAGKRNNGKLIIKQGKKELLRTVVNEKEHRLIRVKLRNGHIAEIEIANGKARIRPLPDEICPRHICSDMGWISPASGRKIICKPNQLVIYFES